TVKSAGLKIVAEGAADKNPPAAGGTAEQTASGGDSTGASADSGSADGSASSEEAKGSDSPLPRTGANIAGILVIAAALLATGSAAAVYSRRKARS
ncbi:LPXTG cell wall anchor domain-containing protein, partial [Brevibacterium sp. HMSC063G07]|uniref:LPXTG cell wall anchor domain-containing protein n=1 Tax=Brevibacterium sp. HMSC063G07 TaxID=1739261 RepID=UPI00114CA0B1